MFFSSENGTASQVMTLSKKNPMLTDLPLLMAGGTFKSLSSMSEDQIEKFLSYLVRYTCQKYKKSHFDQPTWWTESVVYHPEFSMGQVSLPYTRNKSVKLRRLIRLCYISHNCKDLLNLSDKLAAIHALSYKFIRNMDGTVTVMQVSTKTPIVMIPASNLDYDLEQITSGSCQRELSIIPIRKTLIAYDTKPVKTRDDEANNCILIEDSSSDDDVQIVSYEKGAFPPTPPKKKSPLWVRPGPACSKVRLKPDGIRRPVLTDRLAPSNVQQNIIQAHKLRQPVQQLQTQIRHQNFGCELTSMPGTVPRPAALQPFVPTQRNKAVNNYLRTRNNRPRRNQTYTFVDIDLTIDDDDVDDPEKTACLPTELSQKTFLAGFGLLGKGCNPLEPMSSPSPVIPEKKSKMFNLKNLSICQVPFLVRIGILPKRCLCSQNELDQRTSFTNKWTRKDFECSRVTVIAHDKTAVSSVTRRCFVRVKRLNTADLRKWRKNKRSL